MDTLTVMKQALEALEAAAFSFRNVDAITALRTAIHATELREQAAVPSAERGEAHKKQSTKCVEPVAGPMMTIDALAPIVMTPHPAFTRQPTAQRQSAPAPEERGSAWRGLTDEEISDIAINNPPMVHEFARAIEAKLKEKNGY